MINFKEKVSDALSAVIEELSKEEIDNLVETSLLTKKNFLKQFIKR